MHWHSDDVLIGLVQFGEQGVGERKQLLLLRSAGLFRRVAGTDPFRIDRWDGCCVEGWSAIAWWAGLRFDDLLRAYPPMSQAKWASVESSVNLDASGNPDPYFM
jgi:hypothetical protein